MIYLPSCTTANDLPSTFNVTRFYLPSCTTANDLPSTLRPGRQHTCPPASWHRCSCPTPSCWAAPSAPCGSPDPRAGERRSRCSTPGTGSVSSAPAGYPDLHKRGRFRVKAGVLFRGTGFVSGYNMCSIRGAGSVSSALAG